MAADKKGISRREFARRDDCSEGLVRQGLAKGRLIAFDDGSIDPSLVGTPWRQSAHPNAQSDTRGGSQLVSYAEAQRRKENYLAQLRLLEFEVKSGRLVDAAAVRGQVFDLARQERDALVNWPARVSPLIAAELGVDQVALAVLLEKHVRDFLSERSEPRLRFAS